MDNTTVQSIPQTTGERPLPRHIRRSLLCLSMDDTELGEKASASWADAIILDFTKARGRDWQGDLRSRIPAAIDAASRGGAEVFVRISGSSAQAELDAIVFAGIAGVVMKGVNDAAVVTEADTHLERLEVSRGIARGSLEIDVEIT